MTYLTRGVIKNMKVLICECLLIISWDSLRKVRQRFPLILIVIIRQLMMHWLALTSKYRVGSAVKHHAQRARHELTRLFQCKDAKRELSTHLKILPDYFSMEILDQFCTSTLHEQFHNGQLQFSRQESDASSLNKYFNTTRMLRAINSEQTLQCLEAFLHWLLNHYEGFNIHSNNYALELLNIQRPDTWFDNKQSCGQRTFIYHHGPTNSGKSTAAIEDLRGLKSGKGIYMAPLRLLAWEYQQKLQNCSLVTGQEKEYMNSNLISCTIQAAPLQQDYEVAVIDEIQMIGDNERGWAWTRAVLGVKAKRVHLCGDQRALNIISKLLELTGDVLEERKYSRLSKLTLIHRSFKLEKISPGDCIINFSMRSLINHRNDINKFINSQLEKKERDEPEKQKQSQNETKELENEQNYKEKTNHTAIIYGRLPPECRKSQALMFNSRELPYLVATNAIGMGLNLNIRKIVFLSMSRQTSTGNVELEQHQIQQIAGRAGRGKETGYVQCANAYLLKKVEKALSKVNQTYGIQLQNQKDETNDAQYAVDDDKPQQQNAEQLYSNFLKRQFKEKQCRIKAACFYFQTDFIIIFKLELQQLLGRQISNIQVFQYLHDYCKIGNLYFLQEPKSMDYILQLLQNHNMDQYELFLFFNGLALSVPPAATAKWIKAIMESCHRQYIQSFNSYRKVDLPKLIVKLYQDNFERFRYMDQIAELQFYFNLLETYVWLWGKFEFAFHEIKLAKEIKLALSEKINSVLLDNQFMNQKDQRNSFHAAMKHHSAHDRKKNKPIKEQQQNNQSNTNNILGPINQASYPSGQFFLPILLLKNQSIKKKIIQSKVTQKVQKQPEIVTNVKPFFTKLKKLKKQSAEKKKWFKQEKINKRQKTFKIIKKRRIIMFKKYRKSLFGLKVKVRRLKFQLRKHPKSAFFSRLIKNIKKKHPNLIQEQFKVSRRKKKEVITQAIV